MLSTHQFSLQLTTAINYSDAGPNQTLCHGMLHGKRSSLEKAKEKERYSTYSSVRPRIHEDGYFEGGSWWATYRPQRDLQN